MSSSNKDQKSGSPSPSPPNSSSPPPSSSESPPPPSSSSSPPPSSSKSPPPSPPPSSSSPPPSEDDSQSQSQSQSQSPPPPSSKKSPPPPSYSNSKSSPPSPPPPPLDSSRNSSPPPPLLHRSSPSSKSASSSSSSDQEALIAGVAAGVGLLVIIMIALLCCCCKKKKRKPHDQMPYYNHNSPGNRNGDYYNSGKNHTNWNNTGNVDPSMQMPLPPGSATSQQWPTVPPPLPPQMHNNGMMSTMGFSSGPHQDSLPLPHPSLALGFNKSTFTYEELAAATRGFAKENLLGQGGFGYVHKGMLSNGIQIAVKSLKSGSGQGEREFQAEVDIISRVHHRHLVSLVGYCIVDAQRMLVYEFVPNDSLEFHLYGKGRTPMDFPTRLKIALGSAKGFAYLHEDCHPRIIHRDIKAANILIDEHFDAKVADFGLAKLSSDNYTHVSTRIMGTFGYLAPEYASSGKLTEKSDVYSYGVVLLELITGRRPVDIRNDDDSLVDWARPILNQAIAGGSYDELVDPSLENDYNSQEMLRMVACAAACIRHSARRRPKMSQIVRALEGDASLDDLITEGVKPGHSSVFGSSGSEYDSSYNLDGKRFKKNAFSSQEFTSSEHGVTGEFPVHPSPSSSGDSQEIRSNRIHQPSP